MPEIEEEIVEEQEQQQDQQQEEAWKFGEPEDQPKYVTMDQLEQVMSRFAPRTQQNEDGEDEDILDTAARKGAAAVMAQFAPVIANMQVKEQREEIASSLSKGLPESAKPFVMEYLSSYDANGLANLTKHKASMDMIRLAAEAHSSKGSKKQLPRSEDTSYGGDTDDFDVASAERSWEESKQYLPGTTKAQYMKQLQESRKNISERH